MEENNQIEVTNAKAYIFRKLTAKDIPLMLQILKKINVNRFADCFQSETVKKIMAENKGEENLNILAGGAIFLEVAQVIISGLSDCMNEVFEMLASTSNLTLEEVQNLDLDVLTEMIIDFIKKEEFVGFIKAVSKLIN